MVRAVDRQSKDLGLNPSAVETVFFPLKDLTFYKIWIYLQYEILKMSTRTPVKNVSDLRSSEFPLIKKKREDRLTGSQRVTDVLQDHLVLFRN